IFILPGFAWDGYGRPIVVSSPCRIPESLFAAFTFDAAIDGEGKGRLIPIWLRYEEKSVAAANSDFVLCEAGLRQSRIQETFAIQVGEVADNELTSGVNVAGRLLSDPKTAFSQFDPTAPALYDESIPHQSFPEAASRVRWLIPIGFVRWLPVQNQPGHFVA